MDIAILLGIGLLTGVTTVLFGFGGGFAAVPVVVWTDEYHTTPPQRLLQSQEAPRSAA
ncbi:hypothetical protein [Streptomyces malaysiensis]|uniref:hypothetical protein n=1 Tax=Streptomyces malaysiensis TaxID=92644 RepID=UPI002B2E504D|nr:hypothetical protein R8789_37060 [Streptomyces malaysiensis]